MRRLPGAWSKRKTPPPKGGVVARVVEDVAMVMLVYVACLTITVVFGLQVAIALMGLVALALALVLTFGPRR